MKITSIRGAITVEKNTERDIVDSSKELIVEIINRNNIEKDNVINIIFTATSDLDKAYPAVAARNLGFKNTALMCFQELNIENSLKRCIRVCMTCYNDKVQKEVRHVYLKNAKQLRPDLEGKDGKNKE